MVGLLTRDMKRSSLGMAAAREKVSITIRYLGGTIIMIIMLVMARVGPSALVCSSRAIWAVYLRAYSALRWCCAATLREGGEWRGGGGRGQEEVEEEK